MQIPQGRATQAENLHSRTDGELRLYTDKRKPRWTLGGCDLSKVTEQRSRIPVQGCVGIQGP